MLLGDTFSNLFRYQIETVDDDIYNASRWWRIFFSCRRSRSNMKRILLNGDKFTLSIKPLKIFATSGMQCRNLSAWKTSLFNHSPFLKHFTFLSLRKLLLLVSPHYSPWKSITYTASNKIWNTSWTLCYASLAYFSH